MVREHYVTHRCCNHCRRLSGGFLPTSKYGAHFHHCTYYPSSSDCLQNGTLAVPAARSIADNINHLLSLPWALRIATQDWHPQNHVSFASNHAAPNNQVFQDYPINNPLNENEKQIIRLWPDHCVQDSPGAALVPELNISKIDYIIKKGQDSRVEMFSAFKDSFTTPCVSESNLSLLLRSKSIVRLYVVGLATDYCVKHTALHAAQEGFKTTVLKDACKAIDESAVALNALNETFNDSKISFEDTVNADLGR